MVDALPTLLGKSDYFGSNTTPGTPSPFTMPLPGSGTQAGDLLVASIMTAQGSLITPGRGLAELYRFDNPSNSWAYGVWAGLWDGDTTPLAWQGAGYATATGQFFAAIIVSFRNTLDTTRPLTITYGPTVAGLPSQGPAVCINWLRSGLGGVSGYHPFDGTDWQFQVSVDGSYVKGSVAIHGGAVADQTTTDATGPDGWPYMSFGLNGITLAPPCRLYPREDRLGVGSGRIWPAPKSQQASPRRAGGYY